MNLRFFPIALVGFMIIISFFTQNFVTKGSPTGYANDLWFGVHIAYNNLPEFKAEVDEISAYTNLVVIGTTGITYNATLLDEICQYVYDKGLSFIIYIVTLIRVNRTQWFQNATVKWGDHFLGIYSGADEYGGRQLDLFDLRPVWQAENYTDAADQYVANLTGTLKRITRNYNDSTTFPLFISDYALYWFDYKAGCDTVFAEFGWNYSRQLNVALCRGAATVQNKDWGVMIAWTYTEPPYIESGSELYRDLILAYDSGAKYILVFDSDKNYTRGILEEEHLEALKQFWQYVQINPRKSIPISERVACVLPKDYGYGFRGPNDKIWGLWEADAFSFNLSASVNGFLEEYGDNLDIIYDDGLTPGNSYGYSELLPWDSCIPEPSPELLQAYLFPTLAACTIFVFTALVILAVGRVGFAGKRHEAIVKPMKLTFRGMWFTENCTRINTMGQGELLFDNPWRLRCNGILSTDWVNGTFGKIEGPLTFEGENGDRLFVHLTGTQRIDGSYAHSERSASFRIWLRTRRSCKRRSIAYSDLNGFYEVIGGTGRFQGALGKGIFSAHLTIDLSHQHGDLTDGLIMGDIVMRR